MTSHTPKTRKCAAPHWLIGSREVACRTCHTQLLSVLSVPLDTSAYASTARNDAADAPSHHGQNQLPQVIMAAPLA